MDDASTAFNTILNDDEGAESFPPYRSWRAFKRSLRNVFQNVKIASNSFTCGCTAGRRPIAK